MGGPVDLGDRALLCLKTAVLSWSQQLMDTEHFGPRRALLFIANWQSARPICLHSPTDRLAGAPADVTTSGLSRFPVFDSQHRRPGSSTGRGMPPSNVGQLSPAEYHLVRLRKSPRANYWCCFPQIFRAIHSTVFFRRSK